jgi:hypothetical protein
MPHTTGHVQRMSKIALPLVVLIAFTAYSVVVAVEHGPLGFLSVLAAGGWSTQVFLDLVLTLSAFFVLATPDAQRRRIKLWPFAIAALLLGSVGVLAYFVRRQLTPQPLARAASASS